MKNIRMIGSLTSFRFFAALAIVIHHCNGILINDLGPLSQAPLSSGVGFFFVLSGFILSHAYIGSSKPINPVSFFVYRVSRVWPAHVFTLVMVLLLLPKFIWVDTAVNFFAGFLANLFMIQSIIPIPGYYFSLNWVSWSISTEFFFYLIFPVAALIVGKGAKTSFAWFFAASLIGLIVCYACDKFGVVYYPSDASEISSHGLSYINPISRVQEFFIGIAAYKLSSLRPDVSAGGKVAHTTLEVLAVVLMCLLLPVVFYTTRNYGYQYGQATGEYLSHYAAALLFASFIVIFTRTAGVLTLILSQRPMVLLGEISFSLYLTHQVLLRYYQLHQDQFLFIPHELKFAVLLVVSLALSFLIFKLVELPAQRAIRKRYEAFIASRSAPKIQEGVAVK
jgi:peptidoglycan/LPS O-acetylase OafA/YrhL